MVCGLSRNSQQNRKLGQRFSARLVFFPRVKQIVASLQFGIPKADSVRLPPGLSEADAARHNSTQTLRDTWLASVKGRDAEEWVGETIFDIEGCAHVPAQSMYVQGHLAHIQVIWTQRLSLQSFRLKRM